MSVFGIQHSDELSALIAIAETGSFAEAGKRLQRHPSIMSKRVSALERRLGIRMIERSTRSLKLTEAGVAFVERIKFAANVVEEAEREAGHHSLQITGVLRLSLPGGLGRMWLSPLIAQFAAEHPALTVHTEYSDSYADVISGGYDACIRVGVLQDSRLIATRLCDQSRILCVAPSYIQRHGEPVQPSDLAEHNCLGHTGLKTYPEWHLSQDGRVEVVMARGAFISNDGEALLHAARLGIGILGASDWLVARDLQEGRLIQVLPGWTFDAASAIYLVRPSTRFPPHKTIAFKTWLQKAFDGGKTPWERQAMTSSQS